MPGLARLLQNKSSSESQMDCVNKSFQARITVLFDDGERSSTFSDTDEQRHIEMLANCRIYC